MEPELQLLLRALSSDSETRGSWVPSFHPESRNVKDGSRPRSRSVGEPQQGPSCVWAPTPLLPSGSFPGCPGDRRREGGCCRPVISMPPSLPNSLPPGQHLRATVLEQREAGIPLGRGCRTLTLQACPSSRAALSASSGLSITLPVCPEKSMATRELSETLRCRGKQVLNTGTVRALGVLGTKQSWVPGGARDTSHNSEVRVEIQGQTDGPFSDNGFGLS